MRRSLGWALAATASLTVLAVWVPQRATTIVQAIESRRSTEGRPLQPGLAAALPPLPAVLEPHLVEAARRDPFAESAAPPPPPAEVAVVPPAPSTPAVQAPVVAPPPMAWRLLGTIDSPAGERKVLLARPDDAQGLVAVPGLRLEGGYEVVGIEAAAVRLAHPPTQAEVVVPIPPPQPSDR